MSDNSIPSPSDEGIHAQTAEQLWDEVLQTAPAMGRLPDMVAALYAPEAFENEAELHSMREDSKDLVRRGILLYYQLLGAGVLNKFFEHHDSRFGAALELVMEVMVERYEADEQGKNYTLEQMCGWLLGALAITRVQAAAECMDLDDLMMPATEVSLTFNMTQLYLDMLLTKFTFDNKALQEEVRRHGRRFIHDCGMDTFEPTPEKTIH